MKTYNEMADEVFRIGDEQLAELKNKKAKTKKAVITLSSCAAVFVLAIGLWKGGSIDMPKPVEQEGGNTNETEPAITWQEEKNPNGTNESKPEIGNNVPDNEIVTGVTNQGGKTNEELTSNGYSPNEPTAPSEPIDTGEPIVGGNPNMYFVPSLPIVPGIKYVGERLTDEEAKAYFEENKASLVSALASSGVPVDNIRISEKGYSHASFTGKENEQFEVRLNFRDYLVYNGSKLVAIITLVKENGEIYDSPGFGAAWYSEFNKFLNSHKGEELVFLYANWMEIVVAPDSTMYSPNAKEALVYFEDTDIYQACHCPEIVYVP